MDLLNESYILIHRQKRTKLFPNFVQKFTKLLPSNFIVLVHLGILTNYNIYIFNKEMEISDHAYKLQVFNQIK